VALPGLHPERLVGKIGQVMVNNNRGMISTICQNRIILTVSADTV
jgi:hypothetical protein